MKTNKRIILVGLLISIFTLGIFTPSTANPVVNIFIFLDYNIKNLDFYNEYVFIIYYDGGYQIISPDDMPIFPYKQSYICAIKKDDFNESEIGESKDEINNYFENNSKLIKCNFSFIFIIEKSEINNPPEKIGFDLKINSINESIVEIEIEKIFYYYEDNTVKEYTNLPVELEVFFPNNANSNNLLNSGILHNWLIVTISVSFIVFMFSLILKNRKKVDCK